MPCPSTIQVSPGFSAVAVFTSEPKSPVLLGHVPNHDPLARASVAAMIERIGHQTGFAESLRDVVVTARMLPSPCVRTTTPRGSVSSVQTS